MRLYELLPGLIVKNEKVKAAELDYEAAVEILKKTYSAYYPSFFIESTPTVLLLEISLSTSSNCFNINFFFFRFISSFFSIISFVTFCSISCFSSSCFSLITFLTFFSVILTSLSICSILFLVSMLSGVSTIFLYSSIGFASFYFCGT